MADAPPRRPAKGTLRLSFEQATHSPGEPVKGVLHVDLREPTSARRLVVGLVAWQRAVGRQPGRLLLVYRNDKVWEHQVELDGPRRYYPQEAVAFSLPLPLEASLGDVRPVLDEAKRALAALSEVHRSPLEWRVAAFLDRPWHLSPRAEHVLSLTPPASSPVAEEPRPKPKRRPKSKTTKKRPPKKKQRSR